jgi:uncharacterized membrane protein
VPESDHEVDEDRRTLDRTVFVTDGVVAIAMTLLVLNLQITAHFGDSVGAAWRVLTAEEAKFVAFFIAFFVIGQYWFAHRRLFRGVQRDSEALAQRNLWFLLAVVVLPFTTSLMGHGDDNPLPVVLFAGNLILASLGLQWLAWTITRERLRVGPPDLNQTVRARARGVTVVVFCAIPIALAWVSASAAEWTFLLFFFADLPGTVLVRRREARAGQGVDRPRHVGPSQG